MTTKILSLPNLLSRVTAWRLLDNKVVFTNGCFDLLHLGHLKILSEAAAQGDRLIVGLNSDISIHIIKGERRPIMDQNSRSQILAAFSIVDAVVLFDEETPHELIELIQPDVLVKGGDYIVENIAGADNVINNGGDVYLVDMKDGCSSSNIIREIQNL